MIIDLRSDTVTRPTPAMRRVMAEALVGDDVLGDDPTVLRLQEYVAELLGKEAACFVPSGTMANQIAIRAQTEPGDEIIGHADSHIVHYETAAYAALSGCTMRPMQGAQGFFDVDQLEGAMRPHAIHFPASKLLWIENTHNKCGGSVWPIEQLTRVAAKGAQLGLRRHLDGARIWNACAATGLAPRDYARHFDTLQWGLLSPGTRRPSPARIASERCSAEPCVSQVWWPPRHCMHWSTTGSGWLRITNEPDPSRESWRAYRAWFLTPQAFRPTWSFSTWHRTSDSTRLNSVIGFDHTTSSPFRMELGESEWCAIWTFMKRWWMEPRARWLNVWAFT
jgi:hypothetical protein